MQPSLRIPVIALFSLTGACGRTDAFPGLAIPDPYAPDAGTDTSGQPDTSGDTSGSDAADTDGSSADTIEPDTVLPDVVEMDTVDPDIEARLREYLRVFSQAYCDADCRGYGQYGQQCADAVYEQVSEQVFQYAGEDCLAAWAALLECITENGECAEVGDPYGNTYVRFAAPEACYRTYYGIPTACG